MRRFIFKALLFILPFALFFLPTDLFLRNINTLTSSKYDGVLEQKDSIEVLFLGNSHACYSINPCVMNSFYGYNLANVAQQIYFDKRITLKILQKGFPRLQYVFISIDYHSLFTSSQGPRNKWTYLVNGVAYKNEKYLKTVISPFLWGYTPKVAFSLIKKAIIGKIRYPNKLILVDIEEGVDKTDKVCKGFIGFTGTHEESFNDIHYAYRAKSFQEPITKSERTEVINDLEDFIIRLKEYNIVPILFSSPTYHEYNEHLDKRVVKNNKDNINKLCAKYNIQYWRFNEDKRFIKEDFYDHDHLNKKAAKKFSIIINDELKNLPSTKAQQRHKPNTVFSVN